MILMGLDPSLNSLGWFVFNTECMRPLDYGYIANADLPENEKILKIYTILSKVVDKYKIEGVGIEEEFYSKNIDTLKKLSHVHGAILVLLSQRNIPYAYYSVMTAKSKTLNGIKTKDENGNKKSGQDMKEEVAQKIFEIFGRQNFIKDFTSDITDAASIGYTYMVMGGKTIEKPKKPTKKTKKVTKKT